MRAITEGVVMVCDEGTRVEAINLKILPSIICCPLCGEGSHLERPESPPLALA